MIAYFHCWGTSPVTQNVDKDVVKALDECGVVDF